MVLSYHAEYLTRHPLYSGWGKIWVGGTNGSRGYIFLSWFQALCMFVDDGHCPFPGLLRCKWKGAARCLLFCISFLSFQAPGLASVWVTRSSQEALSPALPSIWDGLPELSEVVRPPASLFPEVLGAVAPHLLGLCCCWSALGCSIGPRGISNPCR